MTIHCGKCGQRFPNFSLYLHHAIKTKCFPVE
jgi:hypothetical protein